MEGCGSFEAVCDGYASPRRRMCLHGDCMEIAWKAVEASRPCAMGTHLHEGVCACMEIAWRLHGRLWKLRGRVRWVRISTKAYVPPWRLHGDCMEGCGSFEAVCDGYASPRRRMCRH